MYDILIVDDELLICKGLANLLLQSGLPIGRIYTAYTGYEALDHLKMEWVDLLITDIQMNGMSGIELMQQAKIMKPGIEVIVISAHETFQYAQTAIRYGARDYLVKPFSNKQVLDSVRHVLLHMDRSATDSSHILDDLREHFSMRLPDEKRMRLLHATLDHKEADDSFRGYLKRVREEHGMPFAGPYWAVLQVRLQGERFEGVDEREQRLFQYAVLNMAHELLGRDWHYYLFCDKPGETGLVLEWSEQSFGDSSADKMSQLDMIGRSLHANISKYLQVAATIGISQILHGEHFLPELYAQTGRALDWSRQHKDHAVFFYGDFKWGELGEEPTEEQFVAHHHSIVEQARAYVQSHYAQKGLTLNEVALKNHVSPNYLSYLFKRYTGTNLWEYVIKLRMEESRRLMMTTDLRRYEISEQVGYESPEHFSKIFKKYFGVSPSEMKNKG